MRLLVWDIALAGLVESAGRIEDDLDTGWILRTDRGIGRLERDGKVKLMDVKAPPATWKSPLAACEAALKHEKLNTKQINSLMDLSYAEKDHASKTFLQWFVDELSLIHI